MILKVNKNNIIDLPKTLSDADGETEVTTGVFVLS